MEVLQIEFSSFFWKHCFDSLAGAGESTLSDTNFLLQTEFSSSVWFRREELLLWMTTRQSDMQEDCGQAPKLYWGECEED